MKVLMSPHLSQVQGETSGIVRVVEAYFKYLPQFGVELVAPETTDYDLVAAHAGATGAAVDCLHSHGQYFTADYSAPTWEYETNARVIDAARHAKVITVPSHWVAEIYQRDMHLTPFVVPHGIDWQEWDNTEPSGGYVLWNKNRTGDVCSADALGWLAKAHPTVQFISTFAPQGAPSNIRTTGLVAHGDMKSLVQRAAVYLATTKETFGIGILEALASGVPVLGYAHGGILDLVQHGVNGYLARPDDDADLAEGLVYCLRYRDVLGGNGRIMARDWPWERSARMVAGVYELAMRPDPPTAAIIIPSYNYAELVQRAIASAIAQDYPMLTDIIVVDDGSADDGATRQAVEPFLVDPRVKYVWQNNSGVAVARNVGISHTDAKYVACLDADDAIMPNFLSKCIPHLESDRSLGVAYTGLLIVTPDGKELRSRWPTEFDFMRQLKGKNQIPTCCVFRREAWKRLGGYRQRYAPHGCGSEDAEFWLRLGAAGWDAKMVTEEPLFRYHLGGYTADPEYKEVDYTLWHPWTKDGQHPFASVAKPIRHSHPVRQYDEPLVSIIIPVGPGHTNNVWDAIDSVESQTFRNWECIVAWDAGGGTNNLALQDAFPFVRLVTTKGKQGAGAARNAGAKIARAPLLLFLDADDWLEPLALETMLREQQVQEFESAIYTDCVGRVVLNKADYERMKDDAHWGGRILAWNGTEAAILYKADEYDHDRACRQPDMRAPYLWNYITTLHPKAWYDEVGGFDESMPSWEDWDYWLRLARAGKCFVRVPEPLMTYRFYTGGRRAIASADAPENLQIAQNLVEYLQRKYQEVPVMPCQGCGKKQNRAPQSPNYQSQMSGGGAKVAGIADGDVVEVLYTHPNKGEHPVYGPGTGKFYGYRCGSDKFLVLKADVWNAEGQKVAAYFEPIAQTPTVVLPQRRMVTAAPLPPAPVPIQQAAPEPVVEGPTLQQAIAEATQPQVTPAPVPLPTAVPPVPKAQTLADALKDAITPPTTPIVPMAPTGAVVLKTNMLDMGVDMVPGIGPMLGSELKENGVKTARDIQALGVDGLKAYKGIGEVKAARILETIEAMAK